MFTAKFWKESFERAVRAAALSLSSLFTVDAIADLPNLDGEVFLLMGVGPFVGSLLLSLAAEKVNPNESGAFTSK